MNDQEPLAPLACLGGLYGPLQPTHGEAVRRVQALLAALQNASSNVYDLEDAVSAVELSVGVLQRRLEVADNPALLHVHAVRRYQLEPV